MEHVQYNNTIGRNFMNEDDLEDFHCLASLIFIWFGLSISFEIY